MGKFNTSTKAAPFSPITTDRIPTGTTFEGAPGYQRDTKSELFLLAVSNMASENTFYEPGDTRDTRCADLVHAATLADPEWTARFLRWLRADGHMRSASIAVAAEFAKARLDAGLHGQARQIIDSALQRADEPGEMLAYWIGVHGPNVPKPVKRGVADAVQRLYDERSYLKWDSDARGIRFARVIQHVHPVPRDAVQDQLFAHILDMRFHPDRQIPPTLTTLRQRRAFMDMPVEQRRACLDVKGTADVLRASGMTWESLAGWMQAPMDARAWEAIIPSMGYMALLRNIRNFDEAGVSDVVAATVAARLADPEEVAASQQFPYRFLSAYETAPSLRWGQALDTALRYSLANLPELPGRSLILIDTSASMSGVGFSARSKITPAKAAAVFGVALGAKGEQVDIIGFADRTFRHDVPKGASVIREVGRFLTRIGEVGHGTDIHGALRRTYAGHDRVFVISDMQTVSGHHGYDIGALVPKHVPIYGFNLGGYQHSAMATGMRNRHEFGGLTDATFRMIPLLEAGRNADWPF